MNSIISTKWRPPRKSGLTPKTAKGKIVHNAIIQSPQSLLELTHSSSEASKCVSVRLNDSNLFSLVHSIRSDRNINIEHFLKGFIGIYQKCNVFDMLLLVNGVGAILLLYRKDKIHWKTCLLRLNRIYNANEINLLKNRSTLDFYLRNFISSVK